MVNNNLTLFENKKIRRDWNEKEETWYFSVVDIIAAITESVNPQVYWRVLKKRLLDEGANETVTNCNVLKMEALDGKMRDTDVGNLKTILRLVQSIPSPKVEPLKQWLAQVGQERVEEIQDPEKAITRAKEIYAKKGYDEEWVAKRMRGINVRNTLTDEWQKRGAKQGLEFAILTNEIYKGTFEKNKKEISEHKNLRKDDNLRDHMGELELILTMLGEATSTEIHNSKNSNSFSDLQIDAKKAGKIAGETRQKIELETGKKVLSKDNFLQNKQNRKLLKRKEN